MIIVPVLYPRKMREELRWWSNTGKWKYNISLLSAGTMTNLSKNLRKSLGVRDDVKVMVDSGGFQVSSGKRPTPLTVLEMEEKGDIGFILDEPPYSEKIGASGLAIGNVSLDIFKEKARMTEENGKKMMEYRRNVDLWGIIQGDSWDKLNTWYDIVSESVDYPGYAMAPKSGKSIEIATHLRFCIEHNIKKIHILGVTSFKSLYPAVYAYDKFDWLTADSRKWLVGQMYGQFFNPLSLIYSMAASKSEGGKLLKVDNCPFCSAIDKTFTEKDIYDTYCCHNLFWQVFVFNVLYNSLKINRSEFVSVVRKWDKNVENVLDIIDNGIIEEKNWW